MIFVYYKNSKYWHCEFNICVKRLKQRIWWANKVVRVMGTGTRIIESEEISLDRVLSEYKCLCGGQKMIKHAPAQVDAVGLVFSSTL